MNCKSSSPEEPIYKGLQLDFLLSYTRTIAMSILCMFYTCVYKLHDGVFNLTFVKASWRHSWLTFFFLLPYKNTISRRLIPRVLLSFFFFFYFSFSILRVVIVRTAFTTEKKIQEAYLCWFYDCWKLLLVWWEKERERRLLWTSVARADIYLHWGSRRYTLYIFFFFGV